MSLGLLCCINLLSVQAQEANFSNPRISDSLALKAASAREDALINQMQAMGQDLVYYKQVNNLLVGVVVLLLLLCIYILDRSRRKEKTPAPESEVGYIPAMAPAQDSASSQYVTMVSHEIRTQVNGIIGLSDLLQKSTPRPDQAETVEAIVFTAENLLALLNGVLDYGKLDAGRVELDQQVVVVANMVHKLTAVFRPQAAAKGLGFEVKPLNPLPEAILADEMRITQVLNNLLSNAIKFTEQGSVQLTLHFKEGKLRFEVVDTGRGIAPEYLPSIFQPFNEASTQTSRTHGGTGLGLSIAHKMAQALGGTLTAYSTLGQGSTFRLLVPAPVRPLPAYSTQVVESGIAQEPGMAYNPTSQAVPQPLLGVKVLVVEDSPSNRMVYTKLMTRWGGELRAAASAEEAKTLLTDWTPCLALLDLDLPGMNGVELAQFLRLLPNWGDAVILALTGHDADNSPIAIPTGLFDQVLLKPIEPDHLLEIIKGYCAERNLKR